MLLKEVVDEFLQYLRIELSRSINTQNGYEKDLNDFLQFINEDNFTLGEITPQVLSSYMRYLTKEKGNKPNTARRKNTTIKSFCKFLVDSEFLEKNPADSLIRPKKPQNYPRHLYKTEVDKLFVAMPDHGSPSMLRDKTVVVCLYYTGVRVNELVNIKEEDMDFENDFLKVTKGKGGRFRKVPLHPVFKKQLQEYMDKAPELINGYLFCNKKGKPISERFVNLILEQCSKNADLPLNVSAHMLRHTFATHLYRNGVDIMILGKLLGHSGLRSTSIYTHTDLQHLREGVEKLQVSKKLEEKILKIEEVIYGIK